MRGRRYARLRFLIVQGISGHHQHADPTHLIGWLPARSHWPRDRPAESCDELAPSHSSSRKER
jgi:hypothetical protein